MNFLVFEALPIITKREHNPVRTTQSRYNMLLASTNSLVPPTGYYYPEYVTNSPTAIT